MTLSNEEIEGMQETVSDVQLAYLCTIQRDRGGAEDAWHNPQAANWTDHLVNVRCWYWVSPGANAVRRRPAELGSPDAQIDTVNIVLPAGTDVTERDRIRDVTLGDYTGTLVAGPLTIREVRKRLNYTHLLLNGVR